jgi:hypothetical protein
MARYHHTSMTVRTRSRCRRQQLVALTAALVLAPIAGWGQPESLKTGQAVVGFDQFQLDADGLIGADDGKRAIDYEYCIPDTASAEAEVRAIDPTARILAGSRGRVGCVQGQVLVLGTTHQPDFLKVLGRLAELSYVQRIEQAYFE